MLENVWERETPNSGIRVFKTHLWYVYQNTCMIVLTTVPILEV